MTSPIRRISTLGVGTVVALGVAAGATALASIPDSDGTVHTCYGKASGYLRVIDAARQKCTAFEAPLSINQRGPQGPPGPAGTSRIIWGAKQSTNPSGDPLPSSTSPPAIGTLALPAGSWLITASVQLANEALPQSSDVVATCSVVAGNDATSGEVQASPNESGQLQVLTIQVAHTFAAVGQAAVQCFDTLAQPAVWRSLVLTAVQATSVTQTSLG